MKHTSKTNLGWERTDRISCFTERLTLRRSPESGPQKQCTTRRSSWGLASLFL